MATKFAGDLTAEARTEPRDDVHYHARGTLPGRPSSPLLIVNISPSGLMIRTDVACAPGDRLSVMLPVVGLVAAEVRWALGGRIGCHLDRSIPLPTYYALFTAMTKGR